MHMLNQERTITQIATSKWFRTIAFTSPIHGGTKDIDTVMHLQEHKHFGCNLQMVEPTNFGKNDKCVATKMFWKYIVCDVDLSPVKMYTNM